MTGHAPLECPRHHVDEFFCRALHDPEHPDYDGPSTGPTTWDEIRTRSHEVLNGVPIQSDTSARAVAVLLAEFVGRVIDAPGHEGHAHKVVDLGIKVVPPRSIEIDVRVDPCPQVIDLTIVRIPPTKDGT